MNHSPSHTAASPSIASTPQPANAQASAQVRERDGQWLLVAGGGRHNAVMLRMIAERTGLNPEPVEALGWNGDALEAVSDPYKRYLESHFRDTFNLVGTPVRIELKSGKNPFAKEQK